MKPIPFIARRYLFSGQRITLLSVLTWLSIAGVTVGTALLIAILSVFNGFYDVIHGMLQAQDPDIRIEHRSKQTFRYSYDLVDPLQELEGVASVTPYLSGKSMLTRGQGESEVVTVRGVDPETFLQVNPIDTHLESGSIDLEVRDGRPGIIISRSLQRRYRLREGDELVLLSASGMRRALTQFSAPRTARFQVRGVFSLQEITPGDQLLMDLEAAQRLFGARDQINGLDLALSRPEQADQVRNRILQKVGPDWSVQTWYDLQRPLYDVMELEKWGSYFILMIIVLVAVLNIVGSLTMLVLQKRRDIGILRTMGMTSGQIGHIFRVQGLLIGLIGSILGGGAGLLLVTLQDRLGLISLSSSFILDAYPVALHGTDVALVLGGSMLLCLAASWYPSRRAAAIDPAEAVRYE